jgi:hypothetical protein
MHPELIGSRYRVERAIGQGGMGTVWLCHDEVLRRQVAVKQVGLVPGVSATDSARALREARSAAGLSHRNVVSVFDVVEEAGHIWLVMEHVSGRSLSEIIHQDGPLDPATVADIGAQVAAGLAAAHAAGVTHRDVKPGNVLLTEDGVAKISDFGIARTQGDPALTQSGFLTGTPSYFSPELARGAEPGAAHDVWALGATLYAAVEGHPAYGAQTNPVAVLHEIASGPPPEPQRAAFLAPLLERMMDRDPHTRWSMDDAAHVLQRTADRHRAESTLRHTLPDAPLVATPSGPPDPEPAATAPVAAPAGSPPGSRTGAPTAAEAGTQPPAPQAPAPVAAAPDQRRTPRDRRPLVAAAVLLSLALLAGLLWWRMSAEPAAQRPGATAATSRTPAQDSGSGQDGATGGGSGGGTGASAAQQKESFVRDYYATAPGGTDEAWAMLSPRMQGMGRDSYDGFWRTIESVTVRSAQADATADTVRVTLTYRGTDGRTSTERKLEGLVSDGDGGYLIDSDEPAG